MSCRHLGVLYRALAASEDVEISSTRKEILLKNSLQITQRKLKCKPAIRFCFPFRYYKSVVTFKNQTKEIPNEVAQKKIYLD